MFENDTGTIAHFFVLFFISINIYILFGHSLIYLFTNSQRFESFSVDLNVALVAFSSLPAKYPRIPSVGGK